MRRLRTISVDELKNLREHHANLECLDLRSVSQYMAGSVAGAMNLPQDEPNFLAHLKKIWLNPGPVVLIPATHDLPEAVLAAIEAVGGNVVGVVDFSEWTGKNHPLQTLTSIRLDDVLKHHGELRLLDVRTPAEWEKRHIPGSVNLPLAELQTAPSALNPNAEYVVFCAGVYRGLAGTAKLAAMGFSVRYLPDGVAAWYEHQSQVETQGHNPV